MMSLLLFAVFFGGMIAGAVYGFDTVWPIFALAGAGAAALWTAAILRDRKRRRLDEHAAPICCPKCRFLTATPSGICPRCGTTIPSRRCRNCDYDLRGNTTGACSECGVQWSLEEGMFRCPWPDCFQPNPNGAQTCQHCGKETGYERPMSEKEMAEWRESDRFSVFSLFGILPRPYPLVIQIIVLIAIILIMALLS